MAEIRGTPDICIEEQHVRSAVFLGLATVDLIYAVESVPCENEKCVAQRQEITCGGPAANAATTCAFLGGDTTLVSSVGTHPLADVIRHELEHFRVSLRDLAASSSEAPPVSSILVSQGTGARTVISGHATRTQVPSEAFDISALKNADLLLVDGHQMACSIKAAASARAQTIPVVFDGGSWKDRTDELLTHTRIAICSETFRPPGTKATLDVLEYLLGHGPDTAVITQGAGPIIWATHQKKGELSPPPVAAIDTLGAGDIFHGAFCFRLVSGGGFLESLTFAAEVAAYSCRFFGTRSWMDAWRPRINR